MSDITVLHMYIGFHVRYNVLSKIISGHSGPISCLAVTQHSQYLLTGSEDTSVIVWDMKTLTLSLRIQEHIAPVLCLTTALTNFVIVRFTILSYVTYSLLFCNHSIHYNLPCDF